MLSSINKNAEIVLHIKTSNKKTEFMEKNFLCKSKPIFIHDSKAFSEKFY